MSYPDIPPSNDFSEWEVQLSQSVDKTKLRRKKGKKLVRTNRKVWRHVLLDLSLTDFTMPTLKDEFIGGKP